MQAFFFLSWKKSHLIGWLVTGLFLLSFHDPKCHLKNSSIEIIKDLLLSVHVVVKNVKFGNFSLLFEGIRQRMLLKCVSHVQHDYISSFIQSDHCFLALSLPLLSSLIKLPNGSMYPTSILPPLPTSNTTSTVVLILLHFCQGYQCPISWQQ